MKPQSLNDCLIVLLLGDSHLHNNNYVMINHACMHALGRDLTTACSVLCSTIFYTYFQINGICVRAFADCISKLHIGTIWRILSDQVDDLAYVLTRMAIPCSTLYIVE